jgi:hypothetical protein
MGQRKVGQQPFHFVEYNILGIASYPLIVALHNPWINRLNIRQLPVTLFFPGMAP